MNVIFLFVESLFYTLLRLGVLILSILFQGLLGAVSGIIADHSPYKSSYDSQFKAFVCAALK